MLMRLTSAIFFCLVLLLPSAIIAQDSESKLNNFWQTFLAESDKFIEKSFELTSEFIQDLGAALDAEFKYLENSKLEPSSIDIQEKIDELKFFVQDISQLKNNEINAPSYALISKSKKDYRIKIDDVLKEIEPLLFSGEVVNYSSKIRDLKKNVERLEQKKVNLNEDLFFAPEVGTILKPSKDDIKKEIENINSLVKKSEKLINQLEFDLKEKMRSLGIKISREQIRVMTTRVDGDELARSFAIFDVTRQITKTLGSLVEQNSFNAESTVKYYGVYVILSEILGYSQREYINKIEKVYIPALSSIESDVENSIDFAKESIQNATSESNRVILRNNIKSNQYTLRVLGSYKSILKEQIKNLEDALIKTNEQIMVSYSTYDTAANSSNLINIIDQTQNSFDQIMEMQIPNIIPFENIELELKFEEISNQIINSSS